MKFFRTGELVTYSKESMYYIDIYESGVGWVRLSAYNTRQELKDRSKDIAHLGGLFVQHVIPKDNKTNNNNE